MLRHLSADQLTHAASGPAVAKACSVHLESSQALLVSASQHTHHLCSAGRPWLGRCVVLQRAAAVQAAAAAAAVCVQQLLLVQLAAHQRYLCDIKHPFVARWWQQTLSSKSCGARSTGCSWKGAPAGYGCVVTTSTRGHAQLPAMINCTAINCEQPRSQRRVISTDTPALPAFCLPTRLACML